MRLIVKKFGGTSLADINKINFVAKKIKDSYQSGDRLVIVVSAMSGKTNELISYCSGVSSLKTAESLREYDVALSSGEIVNAALLALALQNLGLGARSFQSWQACIRTDSLHSKALVESVNSEVFFSCFARGEIAVVCGFQGVDSSSNVTTLGRGGSDTTAAAVAAAICADICEIYTDVSGVYTSDPRIVNQAQRISKMNYEEALELCSLGAKVLHERSVQIAMRYNIPLVVKNSFDNDEGTLISSDMETRKITGVAYNNNIAFVEISGDIDFNLLENFSKLTAENEITVKNLSYFNSLNSSSFGKIIFTLPLFEVSRFKNIFVNNYYFESCSFAIDTNVSMVSLVGYGLRNDGNLLLELISLFNNLAIKYFLLTQSDISFSVIIPVNMVDMVVKNLHQRFIEAI